MEGPHPLVKTGKRRLTTEVCAPDNEPFPSGPAARLRGGVRRPPGSLRGPRPSPSPGPSPRLRVAPARPAAGPGVRGLRPSRGTTTGREGNGAARVAARSSQATQSRGHPRPHIPSPPSTPQRLQALRARPAPSLRLRRALTRLHWETSTPARADAGPRVRLRLRL